MKLSLQIYDSISEHPKNAEMLHAKFQTKLLSSSTGDDGTYGPTDDRLHNPTL